MKEKKDELSISVLVNVIATLKRIVDNDYGFMKGNAEMIDKHQLEIRDLKKKIEIIYKSLLKFAKVINNK